METIFVVCAVTATLAFVALAAQAILTLRQLRQTAKAVEYLALNADGKLTAMDPVVDAVQTVASGISSGWFRAARAFYGFFAKK
ncbi:MAG: hypothetical protein A2X28_05695 [Elusimicrobia bacterium GWA2_56_46]|nr:MAG: hypothetical protein A2X28_05695 [Elusimicrobia bacterium GWA2_56_46]OGR53946.1 MAG: hypothetical protein A2X39_07390 [Elusimicrobia bacterium GWC2_56_31]HBB68068.1 hypothetical protein [Elusimicrobiota bacterium]HBW23232.1 hypothetical protein [Elusimicrobiota bacterium]